MRRVYLQREYASAGTWSDLDSRTRAFTSPSGEVTQIWQRGSRGAWAVPYRDGSGKQKVFPDLSSAMQFIEQKSLSGEEPAVPEVQYNDPKEFGLTDEEMDQLFDEWDSYPSGTSFHDFLQSRVGTVRVY